MGPFPDYAEQGGLRRFQQREEVCVLCLSPYSADERRSSLLRRLWAANSLDLLCVALSLRGIASLPRPLFSTDFLLTVTSVVMNYMGPFFLKCVFHCAQVTFMAYEHRTRNILQAIGTNATPETRAKAYVFALLSFVASACKVRTNSSCPPCQPR